MPDPHRCHALGCNVTVPRRMFMCRRHWFMVPKKDRDLVWALYVPGQENDWGKVTPEYARSVDHSVWVPHEVLQKAIALAGPPPEFEPLS